jgi:hypothetical protein
MLVEYRVSSIELQSVLHTAATTKSQVSTDETSIAEILLGPGKLPFFTAGGQLLYRRLKNVTQPPPRLDKKITAEGIAVMLDYNVLTASPVECADGVPACNVIRQQRIKIANAQIPRPIFVPAVKYPAQKLAILLRRKRELQTRARRSVYLHTRNKL